MDSDPAQNGPSDQEIQRATPVNISAAKPSEAATLSEIALAAKSHWGYPVRWLEMWRDLLTITQDYIDTHGVYVARVDGNIVGFSALEHADAVLYLQHLWVRPACMGRGVGQALFRHAQQQAGALGCAQFEIEADPNAAGFYERMGARQIRTSITQIEGQTRTLPVLVCRSLPPTPRNA